MGAELRAVIVESENAEPFEDFWLLYPRRVAKKDARKMWARIPESLHNRIFISIVAWRRVWKDKEENFIPYPATWLNGERWEDDLPQEYRVSHASHVPAAPSVVGARTEMPQSVRDVIAKLKAGSC